MNRTLINASILILILGLCSPPTAFSQNNDSVVIANIYKNATKQPGILQ